MAEAGIAPFLRPTAVAVDAVAMYKQFWTRVKDRQWQGKVNLDTQRGLRILRSEVCEFGGNWLPERATGISGACDQVTRIIYWAWDHKLCELAIADPSSLGAPVLPNMEG